MRGLTRWKICKCEFSLERFPLVYYDERVLLGLDRHVGGSTYQFNHID